MHTEKIAIRQIEVDENTNLYFCFYLLYMTSYIYTDTRFVVEQFCEHLAVYTEQAPVVLFALATVEGVKLVYLVS